MEQQPQPQPDHMEPLYAQVNKQNKRRPNQHMPMESGAPDGGADSWV